MILGADTAEAIGRGIAPAVAIFVYGNQGYGHFAEHLALSLKVNSPGIPVHLWIASGLRVQGDLFTQIHDLDPQWTDNGPGTMKLHVHDILPEGEWLYLDADMINLSDVGPVIERLKAHDFALEVKGSGKEHDSIPYTPWATQTTIKEVNGFADDATYYGVQTSWMWIRKGSKLAADIFARALACEYTQDHLKEPWGRDIPDELRVATALTALGHTPHSEAMSFYGSGHEYSGLAEVRTKFQFACLYGDSRQHRLVKSSWMDAYDRYVRSLYAKNGRAMRMDVKRAMGYKYTANEKVLRKQAKATPKATPPVDAIQRAA